MIYLQEYASLMAIRNIMKALEKDIETFVSFLHLLMGPILQQQIFVDWKLFQLGVMIKAT